MAINESVNDGRHIGFLVSGKGGMGRGLSTTACSETLVIASCFDMVAPRLRSFLSDKSVLADLGKRRLRMTFGSITPRWQTYLSVVLWRECRTLFRPRRPLWPAPRKSFDLSEQPFSEARSHLWNVWLCWLSGCWCNILCKRVQSGACSGYAERSQNRCLHKLHPCWFLMALTCIPSGLTDFSCREGRGHRPFARTGSVFLKIFLLWRVFF